MLECERRVYVAPVRVDRTGRAHRRNKAAVPARMHQVHNDRIGQSVAHEATALHESHLAIG